MKGYFKFFLIGLLITGFFVGGAMADPTIQLPVTPPSDPSTEVGVEQSFTININETVNVTWFINSSQMDFAEGVTSDTYSNSTAPAGSYNVTVSVFNNNGTDFYEWLWTVTSPVLDITDSSPSSPHGSTTGDTVDFSVTTNKAANITWYINGSQMDFAEGVTSDTYSNSTAPAGTYNVTAVASADSETDSKMWLWTVTSPVLDITDSSPSSPHGSTTGDTVDFSVTTNKAANITWYINGSQMDFAEGVTSDTYSNSTAPAGTYNVTAVASADSETDSEMWLWTATNESLSIDVFKPTDNPETTVGDSQEFNITTNQNCEINWYLNGDPVKDESDVSFSSYVNSDVDAGSYNVTATAENPNGTLQKTWTWDVRSKTFSTGNRIWDELASLSTTYTWNANSFSGFYYDLDTGESSEEMTAEINVGGRKIDSGDLKYTATSIPTPFEHDDWGKYRIVGFMAERYFAGYDDGLLDDLDVEDASMMSDGQLSKILVDEDEKESVFSGSSLVLEEGYALNIIEVDLDGDSVFVSLTKDGDELDSGIVSSDDDYVYETDIGRTDDVALIIVHFDEIFRGAETNAVFVEGIFQISDEYTEIDEGESFGKMEIDQVTATKITMENDDSISLSEGKTIDVMGKIKFIVADDENNKLRFAPFVDMSEPGTYELRGTVVEDETEFEWTPLNFEGFYYDIDEGIQTEKLTIKEISGRNIDDGDLVYFTEPEEVSFENDAWGEFEVIGFLAEKYFAGYTGNTTIEGADDVSPLSDGQLSKVLIDDDEKNSVFSGSSLILEEGYALGIVEVDINGERVFVELTKDGKEVEEGIVSADDDFVYEIDLGDSDDVAIIAVHFEEVFRGSESNAVFVRGIFQISEDYVEIEDGDNFGEMEVTGISSSGITLVNEDSISLSRDDTIDVMENIQFKVADSNDVRFYPFVEVSTAPLESLDIDMPTTLTEGDEVDIEVTSRGAAVSDARVEVDGTFVGNTDGEGVVEYEPDESGTFTVTAEKDNFVSANAEIEVISPLDENRKISLEVSPEEVFEGERITISTVKAVGGDPIDDVEVFYDGKKIGETSNEGTVDFTVTEPGVHKITTSSEGYLEAEFNLNVRELAADFEFSSLVVSPLEVKAGKDATITVSATNTGTASGSYNVDLSINNNVVDSQEITLDVGGSTTVEFKHVEEVPGTYLVKVGGQTASYEVVEKTSVVWYILGAGLLAIAGGAIYLFTAGGWTVEMLSAKISELIGSIR